MRGRVNVELPRNESFVKRTTIFRVTLVLLCVLITAAIAQGKKKPPTTPLDLNTATLEQLEQLPGIGPAAAQAIVNFRTKSGRFQRVEDLLAIRGISQRKLDQLRRYVTVRAAAPQSPAVKSP